MLFRSMRIHDLRHFAGTQAARVGNLPETMARLGHSTPKASLIYQGIARGRAEEVAAALSKLAGHDDTPKSAWFRGTATVVQQGHDTPKSL